MAGNAISGGSNTRLSCTLAADTAPPMPVQADCPFDAVGEAAIAHRVSSHARARLSLWATLIARYESGSMSPPAGLIIVL